MRFDTKFAKVALAAGLALSFVQGASAADVNLQFFFPVAVGGKAANTIDSLTSVSPAYDVEQLMMSSFRASAAWRHPRLRSGVVSLRHCV